MKSKLTFSLLILFICSCTNKDMAIREDNIRKYFQAHKEIFNSESDEVFPKILKSILSEGFLEQEYLWFQKNFIYEESQLFDDKSFSLGNGTILETDIDNDKLLVKLKTYHLEYFYYNKSSLDDILNRYNCDPSDIETIIKISNKLDEMSSNGLITGKGWVPMFETHENYTFEFNNLNRIKNIKVDIITGKLTETYDEVITEFINFNN